MSTTCKNGGGCCNYGSNDDGEDCKDDGYGDDIGEFGDVVMMLATTDYDCNNGDNYGGNGVDGDYDGDYDGGDKDGHENDASDNDGSDDRWQYDGAFDVFYPSVCVDFKRHILNFRMQDHCIYVLHEPKIFKTVTQSPTSHDKL